ncbi:hypothetical protein CHUAL_000029 [Chamberlinius hualienensis]
MFNATNYLPQIINEMINKLLNEGKASFLLFESTIEDKVEALRQWTNNLSDESDEELLLSMAGYALRLWDETLTSECETQCILDVQQVVFCIIRNLYQPIFQSAEWLQIKNEIALKLGVKYKQHSIQPYAIQCFAFVEKQFKLFNRQLLHKTEQRIRSLLAYIDIIFQENFDKTQELTEGLKALLRSTKTASCSAALTMHNVGLKLYHRREYQKAEYFLKFSLEYGETCDFRGETSILLADTLLAVGGEENIIKANEILNNIEDVEMNQKLNLIRLKLLFATNEPVSSEHLKRLLSNCNMTEQMPTLIGCLIKRNLYQLALETLTEWITLEISDRKVKQKLVEYQLWLLLKFENFEQAEKLLDILGETQHVGSFYVLQSAVTAAESFKLQSNYRMAIKWLNFCVKLWSSLQIATVELKTLSYYYKLICSCHIQMAEWQMADDIIKLLEDNDITTHFLRLQVAIGQGDEQKATEMVKKLCSNEDLMNWNERYLKMLLSCCKLAIHSCQSSIAVDVFKQMLEKVECNNSIVQIQLMQLMLKLKLSISTEFLGLNDHLWFDQFCQKLHDNLKKLPMVDDTRSKWFVKVLWNVAHCNKGNKGLRYILLKWTNRILSLSQWSSELLLQRKTCLLLSVTAGIEFNRRQHSPDIIHDLLGLIAEFSELDGTAHFVSKKALNSADRIVLLYHLEALLTMQTESDSEQKLFEKCFNYEEADARHYEMLAAICSQNKPLWALKSVQLAIHKMLDKSEVDYLAICQLSHSLIAFMAQLIDVNLLTADDVESTLSQIDNILKKSRDMQSSDKHLQKEIAWLVSKCWNMGVGLKFQSDNTEGARKCCLAAMKLALHLGVDYRNYLDQMNKKYPEIKTKIADDY